MPAMLGWFSEASTSASRWKRASRSWISGQRWRQDLDRDLAFEPGVGRPIDLAHAAFADLGGDLVDAEAGAGSEGQVTSV